jgi:hypothetical protein
VVWTNPPVRQIGRIADLDAGAQRRRPQGERHGWRESIPPAGCDLPLAVLPDVALVVAALHRMFQRAPRSRRSAMICGISTEVRMPAAAAQM